MRKRVLVADDEESLRDMASEVLTSAGYEVVVVAAGSEALERLTQGRFDLALLDEAMPGLTGREVLLRLRATGSSVPALLWSGHASLTDQERVELGVVAVVRKPVPVRALEEIVRLALSGPAP